MQKKIGKGIKIFILDDERDLCAFMKDFFIKRGFQVKTALTGQAAINLLKRETPNIAILDIYLCKGNKNGIDVLKHIKTNRPGCHCVMISGHKEKYEQDSFQSGAEDFLVKPLTLQKLEKSINKMVYKIKKEEGVRG